MKEDLEKVLDFVERYNKFDKEEDVAESASKLAKMLEKPILGKCQISNCLSHELVDLRYKRQICDKCEEYLLG